MQTISTSLLSSVFLLFFCTATAAAGPPELDAEEREFLALINDYRARNGLSPLDASPALTLAAEWMSRDMAEKSYLSHTDSQGRSPYDRMRRYGYDRYTVAGENIAAGSETAERAFLVWRNSPSHDENMRNPAYRAIGIARVYRKGSVYGWYWTTDFGDVID